MQEQWLTAIKLMADGDLRLATAGFKRLWPLESAADFGPLLAALDALPPRQADAR